MYRIAVLISFCNESQSIAKVVSDYRMVLQEADIYIYDNYIIDYTDTLACKVGAIVK